MALEPNSPPIRTVALPLPLSAVRVVCEITHADGVTCDTIIDKMIRLPSMEGRYIANSKRATGEWLRVPEKEDSKKEKKKQKDEDADTLRFEVEEATWTPTLLRAPMPGGVIDELRGKYSKFRTRHEPRYQLALENRERRKAEWKAWAKSGGSMLGSPVREAAAKARDERDRKPTFTLQTEVLEKIGEVMAGKGIELTPQRQREMERNLVTEGVVVGGGWGGVVKGKAEIVIDGDEGKGELEDAMERLGIDEMLIEEEGRGEGSEARR